MTVQKKSMVGNLQSGKKAEIAVCSGAKGVKKTKVESMRKDTGFNLKTNIHNA